MSASRVRATFVSLAVLAAIAMVVVWVLSWTLLSHSDKYGRVSIPGSAILHFPEGELEVAFRTISATTNGSGGALNVPPLSLDVRPANGRGADPKLEEDFGTTSSVNGDAHVRVWTMQVEHEGNYRVSTDGQVGGYINPQLTFGEEDSVAGVFIWLGIAIVAFLAIAIGAHLVARRSARESAFSV